MQSPLSVVAAVAPELVGLVERRYAVLQAVAAGEPVGRRTLSDRLGWSERITRSEVELLREFGLVALGGAGVSLSEAGRQILTQMGQIVSELQGLQDLQRKLAAKFSLRRAFIVPGDCDTERISRDALARSAGEAILGVLGPADVLAISGGSTLAEVTGHLPGHKRYPAVTVAPTGGGLGDALETEANTVAAQLAQALGAKYRLLHLPSDLGEQSVNILLDAQPAIREIFELIRSASIVVQGVGTLQGVAARRKFTAARTKALERRGAVAESLGYFFDSTGKVVEAAGGVGMRLEDLSTAAHVIAVAGGASKAAAIKSLLNTGLQHVLVTDEAAAQAILADDGAAR
jgi:central glycolytic genes regulator